MCLLTMYLLCSNLGNNYLHAYSICTAILVFHYSFEGGLCLKVDCALVFMCSLVTSVCLQDFLIMSVNLIRNS